MSMVGSLSWRRSQQVDRAQIARGSAMPSDDRRPVAGAVFSKREAILLAAAAMTVAATLTVLLSRL